jgi:hypothetical protein
MIEIFVFIILVGIFFIDYRLSKIRRIGLEILKQVSMAEDHLQAMRKYYEPENKPPPLP